MTSFGELVTYIQGLPKNPAEFSLSDRKELCIAVAKFARDYINETCGTQGPYPQEFKNYKKWFPSKELDSPQSILLPVLSDYLIPNLHLNYQGIVALQKKLTALYNYFIRPQPNYFTRAQLKISKIIAENQEELFKIQNTDMRTLEMAFEVSVISICGAFEFYLSQCDALTIQLDHEISKITEATTAVWQAGSPGDQSKRKAAEELLEKLYNAKNEYVSLPKNKRSREAQETVKAVISFSRVFKLYFSQNDAFSVCVDRALYSIAKAIANVHQSNCPEGELEKAADKALLKKLYRAKKEYLTVSKDKRTREVQEGIARQMLITAFQSRVAIGLAATPLLKAFEFYFSQCDVFTVWVDHAVSSIAKKIVAVRQSNCLKDQAKKVAAEALLKNLYNVKNNYINLPKDRQTDEAQKAVKNAMLTIAFASTVPFEIAVTPLSSIFEFYFSQCDVFSICVDNAISNIAQATAAVRQSDCCEDQAKKAAAKVLLKELYEAKSRYIGLPKDKRTPEVQKAVKNTMLAIAFKSLVPFEMAVTPLSSAFEFYFSQNDTFAIRADHAISRIAQATAAVRQSNCFENQAKKVAAETLLKNLYDVKSEYINLPKDKQIGEMQKAIKNAMLTIAFASTVPLEITVTPLSNIFEFYFAQCDAFSICMDNAISNIAQATAVVRQSDCSEDQAKKAAAKLLLKELYDAKSRYIDLPKDKRTPEAQKAVKNAMLTVAFESPVPFEIAVTPLSSAFEFYFSQNDAFTIRADRAISSIAKATAAVRQSNCSEDQAKKIAAEALLKNLYDAKNKYINLPENERTAEAQETTRYKMFTIAFKSKVVRSRIFESSLLRHDKFSVQLSHAISRIAKATAAVRQSDCFEDEHKKAEAKKLLYELRETRREYMALLNCDRTPEKKEEIKRKMVVIAHNHTGALRKYRKWHNRDWHYARNLFRVCVNIIMAITVIPVGVKYCMTNPLVRTWRHGFFSLETNSRQATKDFETEVKRVLKKTAQLIPLDSGYQLVCKM